MRVRSCSSVAAAALLAAGACSHAVQGPRPAPATIPFVVENSGLYDVVVYAHPAEAGPGIRIGRVGALSTTRLPLRTDHLDQGDALVVRLHAVGTSQWWESSPGVTIGPGVVPRLAVYSNPDGSMRRSVLYLRLAGRAGASDVSGRAP